MIGYLPVEYAEKEREIRTPTDVIAGPILDLTFTSNIV